MQVPGTYLFSSACLPFPAARRGCQGSKRRVCEERALTAPSTDVSSSGRGGYDTAETIRSQSLKAISDFPFHAEPVHSQYQAELDLRVARGYRPLQVESYPGAGGIRYAVIFERKAGPAWRAYHGRSASRHQSTFDSLTASGYRPINVSVVSLNRNRRYTAFYERRSLGSWQARSFLTASQYQATSNDNVARGRRLIYLNAYDHRGSPRSRRSGVRLLAVARQHDTI